MREQFFGKKGLTRTSANHIANLAKEYIQSKNMYLNTLRFIGENQQANGNTYITSCATPKEEFEQIVPVLNKISQATQLIAWLREAIKEEQNAAENLPSFEMYLQQQGIEAPVCPKRLNTITEEDVIKSWDSNKYNAYITAQTYAAVFGEFIHPTTGQYSHARKKLIRAISDPSEVSGSGRDLTVITQVPNYTMEEVDAKFFELQGIQREYQAKYNQYRHEITNAIELDNANKDIEFSTLYKVYSEENTKLYNEYRNWLNAERKRIADLKIIIPEALVVIYEEISGLSK